jgi:hypothetical protein
MKPDSKPVILSVAEAARLAHVSGQSIRNAIASGAIATVRESPPLMIERSVVEKFKASRSRKFARKARQASK